MINVVHDLLNLSTRDNVCERTDELSCRTPLERNVVVLYIKVGVV
jgi:hypothetical protein